MKLKEYSIFASAMLSGMTANNQVFYQDIDPDIDLTPTGPWPYFYFQENLDLNHDGINDFRINLLGTTSYSGWAAQGNFVIGYAIPLNNNEIHIASSPIYDWCSFGWNAGEVDNVANYSNGQLIAPFPAVGAFEHPVNEFFENQMLFMQRHKLYFSSSWYNTCTGDPAENEFNTAGLWFDVSMKNVPFKFKNGGNFYTGWIRLSVEAGAIQVHDYAIAMDADESIIAGDITGAVHATVPIPGIVPTMATKAYLNWSATPDALSYRYRYRKTGTPTWITKNTSTTTKLIKSLDCGSNYEWQVQAVYDNTPNLYSAWSALQVFTTGACRLGEETDAITDVQVYPNPASEVITVQTITAEHTSNMFIEMYNMQGTQVKSFITNATTFEIPVSDLAHGNYLIVIHAADGEQYTEQVVITR